MIWNSWYHKSLFVCWIDFDQSGAAAVASVDGIIEVWSQIRFKEVTMSMVLLPACITLCEESTKIHIQYNVTFHFDIIHREILQSFFRLSRRIQSIYAYEISLTKFHPIAWFIHQGIHQSILSKKSMSFPTLMFPTVEKVYHTAQAQQT